MKKSENIQGKTKFDKKDTLSFLLQEYQECFNHLRHYDSIETDFVKFAFSGYIALITACFVLFKYFNGIRLGSFYIAIIFALGVFVGIILLSFAVRNRAYYVIVARQVNSIRNYMLTNSEIDFIKFNKCYLDSNSPPNFNSHSTYTHLIQLIAFFNSVLLFGAVAFFLKALFGVISTCGIFIIFLFAGGAASFGYKIQFEKSKKYLKDKDKKTADEAIFGTS